MTAASGSPFRMKSQWSANSSGIFDAVMPMKPDFHASRAHAVGPRRLVLVVDQRRERERDVSIDFRAGVNVTSWPARERIAAMYARWTLGTSWNFFLRYAITFVHARKRNRAAIRTRRQPCPC